METAEFIVLMACGALTLRYLWEELKRLRRKP